VASWQREDRPDAAVDKILDAAEKAFVEVGVSAAGMAQIAEQAGCSRGTLYRYFPTRHDLHLAYVHREARRIVGRVARRLADPALQDASRDRLVEGLLEALRQVRANPATAAWFEPGVAGVAARMSRTSEVIEALMETFIADLLPAADDAEARLRARWLVRIVVSFLTTPGDDPAEERALIERFAVPGLRHIAS
jgi:AcrR family transcriptional regulator